MKEDPLNRMRIASPCSVGWASMSGDERVRHCSQCNLRVYNISELTHREAVSLIASNEGRICARVYRRADGTVLTRDCPFGLRALRMRAARVAGAALTVLLSLCPVALGQSRSRSKKACTSARPVNVERTTAQEERGTIVGVVTDPSKAVVPGAKVTLINEATKEKKADVTNDKGEFGFVELSAGPYSLAIESPGFKRAQVTKLKVNRFETVRIELQLDGMVATVGLLLTAEEPLSTSGEVIISGDMIRKLPIKN